MGAKGIFVSSILSPMKTIIRILGSLLTGFFFLLDSSLTAQEISINQSFTSDTVIMPFGGVGPVYSVKFSGSVALHSDSSLVRVVLNDNNDNHYLIYEAYPMITDDTAFSVAGVCDETFFLDGIQPASVRIDIINSKLVFGSLNLDTGYIAHASELQAQAKWTNDSLKINMINHRIQEEEMFWRAGRNALLERSFADKERFFRKKYNISGYEFYTGGVFEFSFNRHRSPADPIVVSEFDWRSHHHANDETSPYWDGETYTNTEWRTGWITPIRNQYGCQSCTIFADVAAVEAYTNLYFNNNDPGEEHRHQLDIDLSELQVMRCCGTGDTGLTCGYQTTLDVGFLEMLLDGVYEDNCMASYYTVYGNQTTFNPPCPSCNNPEKEYIKVKYYNTASADSDAVIQKELIRHGPLACVIPDMDHAMLLVGYKTYNLGDVVYRGSGPGDPDIVIDEKCHFLNVPSWFFKDSYGGNAFNTFSLDHSQFDALYYPYDSIKRRKPIDILFSDEDGDGYYWWGVHRDANGLQVNPATFKNCPPGVTAADEDCDDWDVTVGPYNEDTTPGSGPLYSCKPNLCETRADEPLIINEQTPNSEKIWNTNCHVDQNIIIESTTLTIHAEVFFSPGAKIIVMPGGKLELKGTNQQFPARLSSGCGEMWGGIEVHGDTKAKQEIINGFDANHGLVSIENGIVENAICGVRIANQGINPDFFSTVTHDQYYPSGGILQAKLATFRNNQIGTNFYPYRNFDENDLPKADESYLAGCTFETTTTLLNQSTPDYLLKLNGVNGIRITGSTFRNGNFQPAPLGPDYPYRGRGIYCYNSDLYLHDTTGFDSKFQYLEYGIYSMHSGLNSAYVSLKNTTFTSNKYGAYFSGYSEINPVEIRNNVFSFTQNYTTSNPGDTKLYGLYLNNCSGYKVSLNTFNGSDFSGEGNLYGAIINNSGTNTNFIYKNVFNQLDFGLQSQNRNRGLAYLPDKLIGGTVVYPVESGLCFKCNDFFGCKNDIVVVADELNPPDGSGITKNQGTDQGSNSPMAAKEPAGNTFSSISDTSHKQDIDISNSVENIIYLHHHSHPVFRVIPDKDHINNSEKVTLQEHSSPYADYNSILSCPPAEYPGFDFSEMKCKVNEARIKIDSLSSLLWLFVDGGSTDDKNELVLNSTPDQSLELYQDLLGTSPYLSDTVLESAVAKEDVLPNAMITDVLVANPQAAKNEEILNALEERINPLSDSSWNEIIKGVDTVAARERLESQLADWIATKERCTNELLAICLADSNKARGRDSLISLLGTDPVLTSQYKLVNYYIDAQDFPAAESLLEQISAHYSLDEAGVETNQRYLSLLPLLEQLYNDTSGFTLPDSVQQVVLTGIAQNEVDFPGALARDILIFAGLTDYREPVLTNITLKSGKRYHKENKTTVSSSFLKIYPNPCRSYTTIEYDIKSTGNSSLKISLLNMENRILLTRQLMKTAGCLILPVKGWNPGIYFVKLELDGKCLEARRIVVFQ